jgi:hypothetical protein
MERVDWESEISQRKKAYDEGIARHTERSFADRNDPQYIKSRELWKRYLAGEITAKELEGNLGVNETNPVIDRAMEVFDGRTYGI